MSAMTTDGSAKKTRKKGSRLLLFGAAALLLLGGGAGTAWVLVPGAAEFMRKIYGLSAAPAEEADATAPSPQARPVFVELPEMTLTLPNAGRPRQLRLKLAMEVAADPGQPPELMSPRVYDSLVLYLRTLRDGELEGALAMDRLRGDLHRRLDLLLGEGRVRDVLITGFVVA